MKKLLLYGAGLGVLGFAVYRYFILQQQLLNKFSYRVVAFNFAKITLEEMTVSLRIKFISDADLEAKIESVFLDVYVEGNPVGYISNDNPFVVPAHGSSYIDLTFSFSPKLILRNVLNVALAGFGTKDIKFSVDGYAKVKSGWLSTTLPVKYSTSLKEKLAK
jgi:hypothetical protein